ncbi:MAG TPA: gluconate 2-dehydrogenase subunit 3 family protein [Rhodanobacter sp.]|nr:gluconate 2-dehydrogenase subunit 3 family protein [Rhodanobacter sp.]
MREKLGATPNTRMQAAPPREEESTLSVSPTRRALLKATLLVPAAGFLGAGLLGCSTRDAGHARFTSEEAEPTALFFSADERAFVEAATERLIPDEEDGMGAKGAAVAVFIDRQLAGPYGHAYRWYMQGPWENGIPQQGYQLKLTPGELYQTAIRDVNAWCRKNHDKGFIALSGSEQDDVLHGLESGDIKLADVPSKAFFTMLWENTIEGFLADPMYGGNRNFTGWKLVGFPGPRYNYVAEIEQYGKPYTKPTVGILGRDPNRRMKG